MGEFGEAVCSPIEFSPTQLGNASTITPRADAIARAVLAKATVFK